jgi:hypothetical protein
MMADSQRVLTQEQMEPRPAGGSRAQFVPAEAPAEVPVNVSATTMEEIRARGAASRPRTAIPTQAPALAAGFPDANELQVTVTQLAERLDQLETAMQQTGQLQQQYQGLVAQLQAMNLRVESLMNSLQSTVGFAAHQTFVCSSCRSQGYVATRLHCTTCGEESWWGWWPPRQH